MANDVTSPTTGDGMAWNCFLAYSNERVEITGGHLTCLSYSIGNTRASTSELLIATKSEQAPATS